MIRDPGALAALESDWWRLFHQIPGLTPFSSPAWLLPWWQAFAPGTLHSVAIRDGDTLVGLAPLYIEDGPHGRRLLPLGIGVSDYSDVLLHPDRPDAAGCLFGALAEAGEPWDVWSAEDLPAGAAMLTLQPPGCWSSTSRPGAPCPVLMLSAQGSAADAVPPHQRRKWRMAQNRVARRDGHLRSATAETVSADLEQLVRLHAARWEARGEAGVLAPDPVQRFNAAAVPRLLAAGLLRMISLAWDDAVAAVYYGLCHQGSAYAYLMGFDPRFAFESPGTVVVGAAIEAAVGEGCTAFHFLRGQEAYKYRWGATDRWTTCREIRPSR